MHRAFTAFSSMPTPNPNKPQRWQCGWSAAGMSLARGEGVRPAPASDVLEWTKGWNARMQIEGPLDQD